MCLGKTVNEKTHLDFIKNTYRFYTGLIFFFFLIRECVCWLLFYPGTMSQWALSVVSSTRKMYVNGNSLFAK